MLPEVAGVRLHGRRAAVAPVARLPCQPCVQPFVASTGAAARAAIHGAKFRTPVAPFEADARVMTSLPHPLRHSRPRRWLGRHAPVRRVPERRRLGMATVVAVLALLFFATGAESSARPALSHALGPTVSHTLGPALGFASVPGAPVLHSPVRPFAAVALFDPPAQRWLAGHRGIDMGAPEGTAVLSPGEGRVAYASVVVDRGVVTVDHGGGWVSSLEPVTASLAVGTVVVAGQPLGVVGTGRTHCAPRCLHWGVRFEGDYVDPLDVIAGFGPVGLLPLSGGDRSTYAVAGRAR